MSRIIQDLVRVWPENCNFKHMASIIAIFSVCGVILGVIVSSIVF